MCWEIFTLIISKMTVWAINNLVAIITLLGIIAAFVHKQFWAWWTRPLLSLKIEPNEPCYTYTTARWSGLESGVYYFRAKIINSGKSNAKRVVLFLKFLEYYDEKKGEYCAVEDHNPMFFRWSNTAKLNAKTIHPDIEKYCDMMIVYEKKEENRIFKEIYKMERIVSDEAVLLFNLEAYPNNLSNQKSTGNYRVTVILAADNVKPQTYRFEMEYNGWDPVPEIMFTKKLIISKFERVN